MPVTDLLKLSANGTRHKRRSVCVSEEVGRVGNNLADVEAIAGVSDTVSGLDARLEGSSEAADGDTALIRVASRVGECDARRSRTALGCLVDMC